MPAATRPPVPAEEEDEDNFPWWRAAFLVRGGQAGRGCLRLVPEDQEVVSSVSEQNVLSRPMR